MKADEPPAELPETGDRFGELAEQFWQESGYLPPQDNQSWREQDARRINAVDERSPQEEPEDTDFVPQELAPAAEATGFGRVETLFALFTVAAIALFIMALTDPNILTAGFWRPPAPQPNATGEPPASAPTRLAAIPAPALERAPPSRSQPAPTAALDSNSAPAAKATAPETTAPVPETNAAAEAAAVPEEPKPNARPAPRADGREDQGTGGFYAKVAEPDGRLSYRYFPSDPRLDPLPAVPAVPAVPREDGGMGGFYAMVAGPGGALEYKYFPPKASR